MPQAKNRLHMSIPFGKGQDKVIDNYILILFTQNSERWEEGQRKRQRKEDTDTPYPGIREKQILGLYLGLSCG